MKTTSLKVLIIFIILTIIFSLPYSKASLPLIGKTIIIDAGHGGVDPGSVVDNIKEKDINLKISKYLEKELVKKGAIVLLTRKGDYDLSRPNARQRKKSDFDNRIKVINNSHANLYLSIHLNYLNQKKYFGPQVFYANLKDNKKVANHIQKYLNDNLNSKREIKQIPRTIYMYDKLNVRGVLIECGFLSNYNEKSKLVTKKYQQQIAKYIANSVVAIS